MKMFFRNMLACLFLLQVFLAHGQTSATIFDENLQTASGATTLGSGWSSWSWGIATPTLAPLSSGSTPTTFKGVGAAYISFTSAGGGFSPGTSSATAFNTAGYKEINLAVYNVSNGDSLSFVAGTSTCGTPCNNATLYLPSYSPSNTIPVGQWTWFRIPISHLGLGSNPDITWVAIQSSKVGQIYVDELRFDTNTTLYEGVAGQKGPGTQFYYWGGSVPTIAGTADNYWIEFTASAAYGGIQVQEILSGYTMPSASYTHVTVHFQKSSSSQTLTGQLVDRAGAVVGAGVNLENYIWPTPVTATPGVWYRAMVPLSAILGNATADMGGFVVNTSIPGSFKVDDLKFIDNTMGMIMRFPIQTVGYPLGAYSSQKIKSILDHYMAVVYESPSNPSSGVGTILSFTGETFVSGSSYPTSAPQACYQKQYGSAWSAYLADIYKGTGTPGTGGPNNCLSTIAINYEGHPGYDYVASTGTTVRAAASGVVVNNTVFTSAQSNTLCIPKGMTGVSVKGCAAWGAVGIDHGNGYITQYLHMSSITVSPGQVVAEGQTIGTSGWTGLPSVSYEHLHFEVLKLRSGYTNDYQPSSYATVDPYGFYAAGGAVDYLANNNSTPSVCLWKSGCRFP